MPSTVVSSRPSSAHSGKRQLLIGSKWLPSSPGSVFQSATAHAPHSPSAQPSFVPHAPCARSHCRSVRCAGPSAVTVFPFSTKRTPMAATLPRATHPLFPLRAAQEIWTKRSSWHILWTVRDVVQALLELLTSRQRGALATVVRAS